MKNIKKVLKIVGIILLILIVLFLIHTVRNYIIISKLNSKISQYELSDNYHIRIVNKYESGEILTINYYRKGNKQVRITERDANNQIVKMSAYGNGERIDLFFDTEAEKTANLDIGSTILEMEIYNGFNYNTIQENIIQSMFSTIKSEEYNGKKCYRLTNKEGTLLIEKETGLRIKGYAEDEEIEFEYEFDKVDEAVFVEPDIGKYQIKENN